MGGSDGGGVLLHYGSLVSLAWLYLIQGVPYGLQDKFLPIHLRSLGLNYSSVSLLKLLLLPWIAKGVWAPLVEVCGGKRCWLLLSTLGLGAASLAGSFIGPDDVMSLGVMLFSLNMCSAVQDVAVDGLALQILPDEQLSLGNTLQVVMYKVGCLLGGAGLTFLLMWSNWCVTFNALSFLYIVTCVWIYSLSLSRDPVSSSHELEGREGCSDGDCNKTQSEKLYELKKNTEEKSIIELCKTDEEQNEVKKENTRFKESTIELRKGENKEKNNVKNEISQFKESTSMLSKCEYKEDNNVHKENSRDKEKESTSMLSKREIKEESKIKKGNSQDREKESSSELRKRETKEENNVKIVNSRDRKKESSYEAGNIKSKKPYQRTSHRYSDSKAVRVLRIMSEVMNSSGAVWVSLYVLVYKMGERGALNNMPLYLLDKGMTKESLALWNGTVCQCLSVLGSVYGGVTLKSKCNIRMVILRYLSHRFVVILSQCVVVYLLEHHTREFNVYVLHYMSIASLCVLSFNSGVISTITFTFMMMKSRECSPESQASHYSVLASIEVGGKLIFASFAGFTIDKFGVLSSFSLFTFLCVLPIIVMYAMPHHVSGHKKE